MNRSHLGSRHVFVESREVKYFGRKRRPQEGHYARSVMFFVVAATLTWGGAILLVSLGDCRTLYKMMPVEDLRLQVIRSLRRPVRTHSGVRV